jgi:hypothetical protein
MQHHEQVRTAVTHVDRMIWRNQELGFQCLQNSDFAIVRRNAIDGRNFASRSIVSKLRAKNAIRRNDPLESRLNDILCEAEST